MDLAGRTALVTGGAKRVGRGITLTLAGANVVINYNTSADEARRIAANAEALGVQALPVAADVTDDSQVQAMVETARAAPSTCSSTMPPPSPSAPSRPTT